MTDRVVATRDRKVSLWRAARSEALHKRGRSRFRQFSIVDPGWVDCIFTYLGYWLESRGKIRYNDWEIEGEQDLNYSVIGNALPDTCKVAIIGDWGTGLDDAATLLDEILSKHSPDAIIHLGDVYYAGTREEYWHNYLMVFENAWKKHPRVPIFSIPGNHDYYDWGIGYYDHLPAINRPGWEQHASYFCLRTESGLWQFVGMDTGQSDTDPLTKVHLFGRRARVPTTPPHVRDSEILWIEDKVKTGVNTILLSHHQVFSAHSAVNRTGKLQPYLNHNLLPLANDSVRAWFWGHEHNCVLFEDGLFGLAKGRLVGASAYEAQHSEDPYKVLYPEVRYKVVNGKVPQVGVVNGFYNHSYAIVTLDGEMGEVSYYQIPSWGNEKRVKLSGDQKWCIATEKL